MSNIPNKTATLHSVVGHGQHAQTVVLDGLVIETPTARIEDLDLSFRRRIVVHTRPRSANVPLTIRNLDVSCGTALREGVCYVSARDFRHKAVKVRVEGDVAALVESVERAISAEADALRAYQLLQAADLARDKEEQERQAAERRAQRDAEDAELRRFGRDLDALHNALLARIPKGAIQVHYHENDPDYSWGGFYVVGGRSLEHVPDDAYACIPHDAPLEEGEASLPAIVTLGHAELWVPGRSHPLWKPTVRYVIAEDAARLIALEDAAQAAIELAREEERATEQRARDAERSRVAGLLRVAREIGRRQEVARRMVFGECRMRHECDWQDVVEWAMPDGRVVTIVECVF